MATAVNRELRQIIESYDPELLISTETINVLASTSAYALPSDFGSITHTGTGLYEVDADGDIEDRTRTITGPGSTTNGFWIDSTNLNLTPEPQSTDTLILRYMTKDTKFTSLDDTFVVDDSWEELVENGLLVRVAKHRRNSNDEVIAGQRYRNSLDLFIQNIDRTPKVFSRKDYSSYF
jgi:hypothetical protein